MANAIGVIHGDPGAFGISFPDFPGCISTGATLDDVVRKGSEALTFHVEGMIEDGDAIPVARDLDSVRSDKDAVFEEDGVALFVVVPFEMPGKSVRLNISMDENLVAAIDGFARSLGMSRSAFLADAARRKIRETA